MKYEWDRNEIEIKKKWNRNEIEIDGWNKNEIEKEVIKMG